MENYSLAVKAFEDKGPILEEFTNLIILKLAIGKITIDLALKTRLPNGITIYGK